MTGLIEHRERLDKLLVEAKALEAEIEAISKLKECWEHGDHDWDALVGGSFDSVNRVVMKCKRCGLLKDIHIKKNEQTLVINDGEKLSKFAVGFQEEKDAEVESRKHDPRYDLKPYEPSEQQVYKLDSNSVLAHRLSKIGDE